MLTLSRMGAVILPPDPAFYLRPTGVEDIVKYLVGKVLVTLGIDQALPEDLQYREKAN
jgi:4-hydroxy-3-polyprenylbenzoate decarboxylase